MNLELLADPFPPEDIEWRIGQSGAGKRGPWAKVLAYVTARAVMDRFDAVCGPENWQVKYRAESGEGMQSGIVASIGIRIGDEWVWKEDGADQTDIEKFKGGISGALKRAAVAWGVGRYLYQLEATFADVKAQDPGGYIYAKSKDGVFYWKPPQLPAWALPKGHQQQRPAPAAKGPAPSEPAKPATQAPAQPMTRAQLGAAIAQVQGQLNLSDEELAKMVQEDFKKAPIKLTNLEMTSLLETLQRELGRNYGQ